MQFDESHIIQQGKQMYVAQGIKTMYGALPTTASLNAEVPKAEAAPTAAACRSGTRYTCPHKKCSVGYAALGPSAQRERESVQGSRCRKSCQCTCRNQRMADRGKRHPRPRPRQSWALRGPLLEARYTRRRGGERAERGDMCTINISKAQSVIQMKLQNLIDISHAEERRERRRSNIPCTANVAFMLGLTEAAYAQIKELRKRGRREKSKRREKRRGARARKHAYKLFLRKGGQRRNRGIKVVRSGCHSKLLQGSRP